MIDVGRLTFSLPAHEVLEEVDREAVAAAEVGLDVDGEEDVDLALAAELGAECRCGDCGLDWLAGLHGGNQINLEL